MPRKIAIMHLFILDENALAFREATLLDWVAKGRCSRHSNNILHHLCNVLGLPTTYGYPLAALSVAKNTKTCLARLQPVHLHLQRDFFSLGSLPILKAQESTDILAALNAHFSAHDLFFSASPEPQVWHVTFSQEKDLQAHPTHGLLGQDIRSWLPTGADAGWWRQILNEIQMLLFEHPVNLHREASGLDTVNSVWLSGVGTWPAVWSSAIDRLYADDYLSRGLALSAGIRLHPTSNALTELDTMRASSIVLVLESAQDLPSQWLPWLRKALLRRNIRQLHIHWQSGSDVLTLQIDAFSLWKFWRRGRHTPDNLAHQEL